MPVPPRMTASYGEPFPVRVFRGGRRHWLFADGSTLPLVAGGDGDDATPRDDAMPLDEALAVLEADGGLARLSDADIERARAAVQAGYDSLREEVGDTPTDEQLVDLELLLTAVDEINVDIQRREAAAEDRGQRLQALDARRNGDAEDETGEDTDEATDTDDSTETGTGEPEAEPAGDASEPDAIAAAARAERFARVRGRTNRSALNAAQPRSARPTPRPTSELGNAVITASADVAGMGGSRITTAEQFGRAFDTRLSSVRHSRPDGGGTLRYPVMTVARDMDPEVVIRETNAANPEAVERAQEAAVRRQRDRVNEALRSLVPTDRSVLLASGGPCVVPEQSFDVAFVASNATPFTDGLPTVGIPRAALSYYPPLCFDRNPSHTVAAVSTTNANPAITAAAGSFTQADVGRRVTGTGIGTGARVLSVNTAGSSAILSVNSTATGTVTVTLIGRSGNIGRVITAAQDLAGYVSEGGTTPDKVCDHIDCPTPVTCASRMVMFCLTIGNWADRSFAEYVKAWRAAVGVGYAATWEESHIGQVIAGSTLMASGAPIFGAWRDALTQMVSMVEHIISARRLPESTMFRWWVPAWGVDALQNDLAMSIGGVDAGTGYANFSVSDAQLIAWLAARRIILSTYVDESGPTAQGDNQVLVVPTAGTIPTWPASMRTLLYREGAWVRGQGATLELGLIRDSQTIRTNSFQVFQETETAVCAKTCAGESYVLDHRLLFDGLASGLVNPRI